MLIAQPFLGILSRPHGTDRWLILVVLVVAATAAAAAAAAAIILS